MSKVTFIDSYGVRPVAEAIRRRKRHRLPPVKLSDCSPAARFYLDVSDRAGVPIE